MSRGGKQNTRGWLPGQTDRLADTGKALGLAAPSAAAAAAAETLPPPLFPERSLRPFRWWDPEKRDIWLLQKAEELSEALAASPYNLDAPPSAEALQAHAQARTAAAAAGSAPPPPPTLGAPRLLEHLACVRHSHAFPLELVVSRARAARAAARGGGRSGRGALRAPVQQFLRAALKAKAVAGDAAGGGGGGGAGAGGGGGAEGEEGEEGEGGGGGGGEDLEEEEEDEEDWNDYTHDHYGDEDEGGGSEREGGGGGEEGDF